MLPSQRIYVHRSDDDLIKKACIQKVFAEIPHNQHQQLYAHLNYCLNMPKRVKQAEDIYLNV